MSEQTTESSSSKLTNECNYNDGKSSFGTWFSNIVQSARQTVNKTTMDSIKRDLTELKDAVQHDTTNMVYSTASLVKNTFNEIGNSVTEIGSLGTNHDDKPTNEEQKLVESTISETNDTSETINLPSMPFDMKTINSWTNKLTDTAKSTITLIKDNLVDSIFANFSIEELEDEPFVVKNGEIVKIENWKEMLHKLQIDPNTYCREPTGLLEDFDNWLVKFNLINYQKQTEYLLENVPEIKQYHKDLVPQTLSENDFWHRYFYKVHQLKEEQANLIQSSQANNKNENSDTEKLSPKSENQVISRSSTEEWDKMNEMNSDRNSQKEMDSKSSSDDDREWVKYENE